MDLGADSRAGGKAESSLKRTISSVQSREGFQPSPSAAIAGDRKPSSSSRGCSLFPPNPSPEAQHPSRPLNTLPWWAMRRCRWPRCRLEGSERLQKSPSTSPPPPPLPPSRISHPPAPIPCPCSTGLSPSISHCQWARGDGRCGVEGAQSWGSWVPGQRQDQYLRWVQGRGEHFLPPHHSLNTAPEPRRLCTSSRHGEDASTPRRGF